MKFLIVAPRFHTNLYYRVKALQNSGHMVAVVVLDKGKSEIYEGVGVKQIGLSKFSGFILKIVKIFKKNKLKSNIELRLQAPDKELRKIIKSYQPDIIILKAYQNMLAVKTLRIAKKQKIKVLMLTQTEYTSIKGSKFLFKLNIRLFRFLKVFAFITPIMSNFEKFKEFGISNIYYIPFVFPANPNSVKKNYSENNDVFKIMSVGKLVDRKDHILLIKAVHKLIQQGYNIELSIYGEKASENYYNLIVDYLKINNLQGKINLFTNVPYKILLKEYKEYDFFVLPSYKEPAAYSPVEAMANGLPVICSDQNGTKCYIKEGHNGFIFKAQDINSLIEKIKLIILDRNTLQKMSKNSINLAIQAHSLESFEKKIRKIIEK